MFPEMIERKWSGSCCTADPAAGSTLARRGLPCTIIPMPLSGISSPVTRLGSAVGGGSITGVLDMRTSVVSFSAPEAILQDIAVAEVHEHLYGLDFLISTGYTDAKYPNPQIMDRTSFLSMEESRRGDIAANAHERVGRLLRDGDFWEIDVARAREMDRVVQAAEHVLASGDRA